MALLYSLFIYYNGSFEKVKENLFFQSKNKYGFDIVALILDITWDEYYVINIISQNYSVFVNLPGYNHFAAGFPAYDNGVHHRYTITRSLLNKIIYDRDNMNNEVSGAILSCGRGKLKKEWALRQLYDHVRGNLDIYSLQRYLTFYYDDIIAERYKYDIFFLLSDNQSLKLVRESSCRFLWDVIQREIDVLTIPRLREILDTHKDFLYTSPPEYFKGSKVERIEFFSIKEDDYNRIPKRKRPKVDPKSIKNIVYISAEEYNSLSKYLEGAVVESWLSFSINGGLYRPCEDLSDNISYLIFRLAFLEPLVLYRYSDNKMYHYICFENDIIEDDVDLRYAEFYSDNGVFKDITCNGKKVYFGHEDDLDWRFYNLPLYGPCFLMEDGSSSYIYGRTSNIVNPPKLYKDLALFRRWYDLSRYFKYTISKSELFVSEGTSQSDLLHMYGIFGARQEICEKKLWEKAGLVPTSLMFSDMIDAPPTDIKDLLRSEQEVIEYKKYFKNKRLGRIIKKIKRSSKHDTNSADFPRENSQSLQGAIDRFVQENYWCKFNCEEAEHVIIRIEEYENFLRGEKINIKKNVKFSKNNYHGKLNILLDNAESILSVLGINVILETLGKIKKLLRECAEEICIEISEHVHTLTYPLEIKSKLRGYEIYFMAVFGSFVKQNQFDKVEEMIQDMDKSIKRVHQFMMGKGKSAVITPLLSLDRYSKGKKVLLVVPQHLFKQTENFYNAFHISFVDILSINTFFTQFTKLEEIEKSSIIFDEFDMMYDPLSSVMNIIHEEEEWFDEERLLKIFDIVETQKYSRTHAYEYFTMEALEKKLIRNVNYGMYGDSKTVIPYRRKDTPIENSKFASIIYTLVYTILFYKEQGYMLRRTDYWYLASNSKRKIKAKYKIRTDEPLGEYLYDFFRKNEDKRKEFFIWYMLNFLKNSLKISSKIINVLFMDLMTLPCEQVGYTGTVNLVLPEKVNDRDYDPEIIRDLDETVNVYFAITGRSNVSKNQFHTFRKGKDVFKLVQKEEYDCLIDLIAFFKDYDNEEVVRKLAKYINRVFVYLDKEDKKKIYDPEIDKIHNYTESVNSRKPFFFYSQKNSVGIDFRQPSKMRGLILMNSSTTYTEAAQGIYRLRKLNRGHIIDIAYQGSQVRNTMEMYELLIQNDKKAWEARYPHFLVQRFKNLVRQARENVPVEERHTENVRFAFQGDEWDKKSILKFLKENVGYLSKISKYFFFTSFVVGAYDMVTQLSREQLMDVVLGGYGVEIQTQTKVNIQQKTDIVAKDDADPKVYKDSFYYLIVSLEPKEIRKQFDEISTLIYSENGMSFYLTDNVYNNSWKHNNPYLVEIFEGKFLIEPSNIAFYYLDRFPMYSLSGKLENGKYLRKNFKQSIEVPHIFDIYVNFYSEKVKDMWKQRLDIPQVSKLVNHLVQVIPDFAYADLKKYTKESFVRKEYYPEPTNYNLNTFILSGKEGPPKKFAFSLEPYMTNDNGIQNINIKDSMVKL